MSFIIGPGSTYISSPVDETLTSGHIFIRLDWKLREPKVNIKQAMRIHRILIQEQVAIESETSHFKQVARAPP